MCQKASLPSKIPAALWKTRRLCYNEIRDKTRRGIMPSGRRSGGAQSPETDARRMFAPLCSSYKTTIFPSRGACP
jgi:hypothetical protein